MSSGASRLAWLVCAFTLSVLALVLVVILLGWSTALPQGRTPWRDQAVSMVGIVGAPILGALIASRRPRNPYGWVWLVFGSGLALQLLAGTYAAYALVVDPGSLPAPGRSQGCLGWEGRWRLPSPLSCCCCSPRVTCRRAADVPWRGSRSHRGRRS